MMKRPEKTTAKVTSRSIKTQSAQKSANSAAQKYIEKLLLTNKFSSPESRARKTEERGRSNLNFGIYY